MKLRHVVFLYALTGCLPLAAAEQTLLVPGTEAPGFSLPTLSGNREALSVWNGSALSKPHINKTPHTVIISFWATYCKPCLKEIPQLMEFASRYSAEPVKVFLVSIDKQGASKVRPYMQEHKFDLPVLLDPYAKTAERYGVSALPALYVIAPDGIIRYAATGFKEGTDMVARLQKVYDEISSGAVVSTDGVEVAGESVAVTPVDTAESLEPSGHQSAANQQEHTILSPGTEAPSFSLPTLDGSREVLSVWSGELSKPYLNKVPHTVILSFWATYCKPCKKEIPELMKFAEANPDKPIKIFLISIDKQGAAKVRPFVKEHQFTLPVLLDPYARTAERYGVSSVPALFVIGPDGNIRFSATGFDEKTDLTAKMQKVYDAITSGGKITQSDAQVIGESVGVEKRSDTDAAPHEESIGAKERWQAIVQVECGTDIELVANKLGVSPDAVKAWYRELRNTAVELWDESNQH
jgi:thiol-disulfide isomerase/thioredoxin